MRACLFGGRSRVMFGLHLLLITAIVTPTASLAYGGPRIQKSAELVPFTFDQIDLKKVQRGAPAPQANAWIEKNSARHARQYAEAPDWVRQLESKKVADYFVLEPSPVAQMFAFVGVPPKKPEIEDRQRKQLLIDAIKLNQYFEGATDREMFKEFSADLFKGFDATLENYVMKIDEEKLAATLDGVDAASLAEVSLGALLVQRQIDYLYNRPDFKAKIVEYLMGPHMRAASKYVGSAAFMAALIYTGHLFKINAYVATFAGGLVLGGIKNGPVADIFKAMSGWFLRPTTEFIRVMEARYTGKLEEKINNGFDKIKPSGDEAGDVTRNERPKIANLEEDGMNFAGMNEQDQQDNWNKNMRMWVAVAKRFGQLLRDTHHSGRFLMMISWTDEQAAASLIETMATKLITLDLKAETILGPYKTAFLIRGEGDKKVQMELAYDEYQAVCKSIWADLTLSESDLDARVAQIKVLEKRLSALGLSERDLKIFSETEMIRAKATGTMVTAVALNEMRAFGVAEANRNLEPEAREAQRATRFGFNLQAYVEDYLPLVQHQMQLMGFQHSAAPKTARKAIACPNILQKLASAVSTL